MKKFGFILFSLGVGFLCAQEKAQVQLKVIPPELAPAEATSKPSAPATPAPAKSAPAPAVPLDFSEEKINALVREWNAEDRSVREKASLQLEAWVHQNPAQAKHRLLSILRENSQPEARERSVKLLKIVAAAEFDITGAGYIGVSLSQAGMELKHPQDQSNLIGLPITAVSPSSPAEKSGVKAGDIVVSVDGFRWDTADQIINIEFGLSAKIRAKGAGTTVNFGILRNDKIVNLPVTLKRRPANLERLPEQLLNLNAAQGGVQLGLAQGIQFDKKMIDDLVAEEKNSPEYFAEWLKWQESPPATK